MAHKILEHRQILMLNQLSRIVNKSYHLNAERNIKELIIGFKDGES